MVYYVVGLTCVGKDTFLERAHELYPNVFGLVQVGKEFRRRYPPGYFDGKAAMPHTENEALEIYAEQLAAALQKKITLVCGQPRMVDQIRNTIDKNPGTVIWMHVSDETLAQRVSLRFPNDQPSVDLSTKRLLNDRIQLYDVIFHLKKKDYPFIMFDGDYEQYDALIHQLVHYGGTND